MLPEFPTQSSTGLVRVALFGGEMLSEITIHGDWRFALVLVPAAIVIWWISKQIDVMRIVDYGKKRGWRFEEIKYSFFGPGWWGEKEERFYSVRYVDDHGEIHTASCKTSMFTGVFFTNDQRVGKFKNPPQRRKGSAIDCPRCGVLIGEFHNACPNCGTQRNNPGS